MLNDKWNEISKFDDAQDSPGFLLWKMHLIWRRLVEKVLNQCDLTHPQFVVLVTIAYLAQNKSNVTQVELANHVSLDVNTISQILKGLENKGFIKRLARNGNNKAKYPKLTEIGYSTFKQAIKLVEDVDQQFFNSLNTKDLQLFKTSMLTLIEKDK